MGLRSDFKGEVAMLLVRSLARTFDQFIYSTKMPCALRELKCNEHITSLPVGIRTSAKSEDSETLLAMFFICLVSYAARV